MHTTVASASMPNTRTCGARDFSPAPIAVPRNPPSAAAPIISPSATLSGTDPKCTVRSRKARKKIMKPEKARSAALAPIASATAGPRAGNRHRLRGSRSGWVPPGPTSCSPDGGWPPGPGGTGSGPCGPRLKTTVTCSDSGVSTPSGSRNASTIAAR